VPWRFLDAGQLSVRSLLDAGVQKPAQRETHARSNLTAHSITSSAMASSEGGTSMPGRALFSDF